MILFDSCNFVLWKILWKILRFMIIGLFEVIINIKVLMFLFKVFINLVYVEVV